MPKFEFEYDEMADILWVTSEGMKRKTEQVDMPNMKRLNLDRFTGKVVGARLPGFLSGLKDGYQNQP